MSIIVFLCLILICESTVYHIEYDKIHDKYVPYSIKSHFVEDIATVSFNDTVDVTGWATLRIETNANYDDLLQATAAGFAEGYATYYRIQQHYKNIFNINFGDKTVPEPLHKFLQEQLDWLQAKIEDHPVEENSYWYNVKLVLLQLRGMLDGFNEQIQDESQKMNLIDLYMLNSDGDMETLLDIFLKDEYNEFRTGYDCSALIKRVISKDTGKEELLLGHSTWRNYAAMLRVFKFYNLRFNDTNIASNIVGFSASPGFISSKDDYYTTSSHIGAMETTNTVFVDDLYKKVQPDTVPSWIRAVISCRMAKTPSDWMTIFSKYNSGTYNNQWMALNLDAQSTQTENVLVIGEQIPGKFIIEDVTSILNNQTYWSSFNIPYIKEIYEDSGYPSKAINNTDYSYTECSRYKLFARDQVNVVDIESMKRIMQSNNYLEDPLSEKKPNYAIASRYDLRESNPASFGAIDSKITSTTLIQEDITFAISGPTHQSLPPFIWSEFEKDHKVPSHVGLPDVFNFDYVEMNPKKI